MIQRQQTSVSAAKTVQRHQLEQFHPLNCSRSISCLVNQLVHFIPVMFQTLLLSQQGNLRPAAIINFLYSS